MTLAMTNELRSVLTAATLAPSGENSQPWHFFVSSGNDGSFVIKVKISTERDQSLYGWGNRASYVAIGAALENMKIAASGVGLRADVSILPDPKDELLVATVSLLASTHIVKDSLADAIPLRVSNRRAYEETPLSQSEIDALVAVGTTNGYGDIRITHERNDIRALAEAGSSNERIMLANPALHQFFFSHINWTKQEDEARKTGFFIDTLELPPPARLGLKLLSKWQRARFLNKLLGMNNVVGKENAKIYAQSSGIGIVLSPQESAQDAVRAGMLIQRVWLKATQLGLSFQPLAGTLYLALRLHAGEMQGFSSLDQSIINEQYRRIQDIFEFGQEIPYFMFRIGRSKPPSARAIRFSVDEVTTFEPSKDQWL